VGGQCWRIAGDAEAISREHRPLSNLIGISPGPGKYTQGCRGGCRIYSQRSGSRFWSTNSSGLAFGATSRTWGSALLCGTRAGRAGQAGQARQGKARQGKARQGKARQGKARQARAEENARVQCSQGWKIFSKRGQTDREPHGLELQTRLSHGFKLSTWGLGVSECWRPVQACVRYAILDCGFVVARLDSLSMSISDPEAPTQRLLEASYLSIHASGPRAR
jgi:hypothetical protein